MNPQKISREKLKSRRFYFFFLSFQEDKNVVQDWKERKGEKKGQLPTRTFSQARVVKVGTFVPKLKPLSLNVYITRLQL